MNKFNIFRCNLHKFFVNFLQTSLLLLHHPFLFYFFQEFQEIFTIYLHTLRNLTKVQEMKRNGFQNIEKTALTILTVSKTNPLHSWFVTYFVICHKLCDLSQTLWFCHTFCDLSHICDLSQTLWFITNFVICHMLCDLSQTLWFCHKLCDLSQTLWFCHKLCDDEKIRANSKKFFPIEKHNEISLMLKILHCV